MMTSPAPLLSAPTQPAMRDVRTVFGALRVRESHILRFDHGLHGFPGCHEWIMLESERANTVWLQSLDHPDLALLMLDPFVAFADFAVDVPMQAKRVLRARPTDAVAVFAPVALPARGDGDTAATANLCGPVLVNWRTRRGIQCVIDGGPWSVREPVPAAILGTA